MHLSLGILFFALLTILLVGEARAWPSAAPWGYVPSVLLLLLWIVTLVQLVTSAL